MRRTRLLRVFVPGAIGVPQRVQQATPSAETGSPVQDTVSPLDWDDGCTASYLHEACAMFDTLRYEQALQKGLGRRLQHLLSNLESRGCDIGPLAGSKLVALFSKYGSASQTIRFYEDFTKKRGLHVAVLTSMASFYAAQGKGAKVRELLRALEKDGAAPSIHLYHVTLKYLACSRNEAAAFRVVDALAQTSLQPVPRTVHLLLSCCKSHQSGRTVIDSVRQGKWGPGIALDVPMYTGLMRSCSLHGEVAHAWEAFEEMIAEGLRPGNVQFNTLCGVCRRGGNLADVEKCLARMRHEGVKPDSIFFCVIIGACEDKLQVTPRTEHTKWLEVAEGAFNQAVEENPEGGYSVYTALARCYVVANSPERMLQLRKRLHKEGHQSYDVFTALEVELEKKNAAFSSAWVPIDPDIPREYITDKQRSVKHTPLGTRNVRKAAQPRDLHTQDWYVLLAEGDDAVTQLDTFQANSSGDPVPPSGSKRDTSGRESA